jgi:surfactin synthase thioesterase subunit
MADLVAALVPVIEQHSGGRFAFFGHSMGALVAHEVAMSLQRKGTSSPCRLLVSGRRAPHLLEHDPPIRHLADDEFIGEIQRRYNGIPPEILHYPELLELLLPSLRADMEVIETHGVCIGPHGREPISGPISAYGGSEDPRATRAELEAWQAHTTASVVVRQYSGGHFYFNETSVRDALLAAVASDLREEVAR